MRTGWTRWNRLTGTSRYPDESPRVILAVEPDPIIPGRGQGPGGRVRWLVQVFISDRSHPWGGYLRDAVAGNAADCSAGRAAAEAAYRKAQTTCARCWHPARDHRSSPALGYKTCHATDCQCPGLERATDGATRAGSSVVDSHMTDREQGTEAPRVNERTEREVQA